MTQHARSAFHSSLQHDSVAIHPSGFLTPKNYFEASMICHSLITSSFSQKEKMTLSFLLAMELQTKSATEEMSILATRLGQTCI